MADISLPLAPAARKWPAFIWPAVLVKLVALRRLQRRNASKRLLDQRGRALSHADRWASMVLRNRL